MLEFSAMMKGIAAAFTAFATAIAGAAIGVGVWLLLAWLLGIALVAFAAHERGGNALVWALAALVLTPPIAALTLLVLPSRAAERERLRARAGRGGLAICPVCAEVIRVEALRCRYCASPLAGAKPVRQDPAPHSGALQEPPVREQLVREQRGEDQRAAG